MKKLVAIILALVMILSLGACAKTPAVDTPETQAPAVNNTPEVNEPVAGNKIGMILPTLQAEFFSALGNACKALWEQAGYEVTLASYDSDAAKGIEIMENFMVSGVDCIVAMVGESSMDGVMKDAMDKGIKVIVLGVETTYYDVCTIADNAAIGANIAEMAAKFINDELGGEAVVAAFVSQANPDMALRSDSMVARFKELCPDVEIAAVTNYNGAGEGTTDMENMLQQNKNINVVISFSDVAAVEASEVFKAAGKAGDNVGLFSCDATQQVLQLIKAGDIVRGTVYMGDLVNDTVLIVQQVMNGEIETPYKSVGEGVQITIANVDEYLQ